METRKQGKAMGGFLLQMLSHSIQPRPTFILGQCPCKQAFSTPDEIPWQAWYHHQGQLLPSGPTSPGPSMPQCTSRPTGKEEKKSAFVTKTLLPTLVVEFILLGIPQVKSVSRHSCGRSCSKHPRSNIVLDSYSHSAAPHVGEITFAH